MIVTREPQVQYQNPLARANIFLFRVRHVLQYIIGTWYYSVQAMFYSANIAQFYWTHIGRKYSGWRWWITPGSLQVQQENRWPGPIFLHLQYRMFYTMYLAFTGYLYLYYIISRSVDAELKWRSRNTAKITSILHQNVPECRFKHMYMENLVVKISAYC